MGNEIAIARHKAVHVGRIWFDDPAEAEIARERISARRVWTETDEAGRTIFAFEHPNAYVRSGLRNLELLQAGLGGRAVAGIGLDNDTSAVTVNTRFLHGTTAGGATSTTPTATQLFCATTAVIATDGASVVQSTTYTGPTLTAASFTAGVFKINKIGLMLVLADADGNLVDVVGGTGGAQPYERTFGLDFTGLGSFNYIPAMISTSLADPTQ